VLSTHGHITTGIGLHEETLVEHGTRDASISNLAVVLDLVVAVDDASGGWESETGLLAPFPWLGGIECDLSILASGDLWCFWCMIIITIWAVALGDLWCFWCVIIITIWAVAAFVLVFWHWIIALLNELRAV